jgi:hypothetical protein
MNPKTPRRLAPKLKFLFLVCPLFATGAAAAGARLWLPPTTAEFRPAVGTRNAAPRPVTHASQAGTEVPQTELVTITPTGFEPAEVTRPAERFILAVENRSGLEEVTIILRDEGGRELLRERVPRERLDWSGALDLAAGSYLLSEDGNPGWACRLTLTAP